MNKTQVSEIAKEVYKRNECVRIQPRKYTEHWNYPVRKLHLDDEGLAFVKLNKKNMYLTSVTKDCLGNTVFTVDGY